MPQGQETKSLLDLKHKKLLAFRAAKKKKKNFARRVGGAGKTD